MWRIAPDEIQLLRVNTSASADFKLVYCLPWLAATAENVRRLAVSIASDINISADVKVKLKHDNNNVVGYNWDPSRKVRYNRKLGRDNFGRMVLIRSEFLGRFLIGFNWVVTASDWF